MSSAWNASSSFCTFLLFSALVSASLGLGQADMTPILGVRVKVTATDSSGNTQRYEKSIAEIALECLAAGGKRPRAAEPTSNAKPTRSASGR